MLIGEEIGDLYQSCHKSAFVFVYLYYFFFILMHLTPQNGNLYKKYIS